MQASSLNAIYSDILSAEDLIVSDELFDNTLKEKIITEIEIDKTKPSINIYATSQLYLSFNNTDFT